MPSLIPIEHQNRRVLTTQQLAEVYETEPKNIQMNFSNNKERFQYGRDYHLLEGDDLKAFKDSLPNDIGEPLKYAPSLYLWTSRGANRHCKILDTDQAWAQFDVLEETYFRVKESLPVIQELSPQLQLLINIELKQKKQDEEIKKLLETTQNIKDTIITQPDNWRDDLNKMFNKIVHAIGENKFRDLRTESYKLLEQRAHVDLTRRLINHRSRLLEQGATKTNIEKANKLDVIEQDVKLREIYSQIVKEYFIAHCA